MASKALTAGMIATILVRSQPSQAADGESIEEVRQELRQLRAQVQALRSIIAEFTEYDRQRAAFMARALKALSGGPEGPQPTPPARAEPIATARPWAPESPSPAPRARVEGAPARRLSRPAPPAGGTVRGNVSVPANEPVAYVYVENVMAPAARGRRVVIEQSRKAFVPSWAVVQRGTTIAFPNSDTIFHNVFSLSPGNSFDLGLYNSSTEGKVHTFAESGPVDVYCNIHPQMAASVLVVPNRHFARIRPNGSFEINGVPVGKRKLVAWSPGSRLTAEWVDVSADEAVDVTLKLEPKSPRHDNKAGQPYGSYE